MSDYLSRLVGHAGSSPNTVRPALPSLFERVKAGGALAAVSMSRGTEPISGTEHDLRPTSEPGLESRSIHDRVASIQAIWTAAITSAAPPKTAAARKRASDGLGRMPVAGQVIAEEAHNAMEPPARSPHEQPALGPHPAQSTTSSHWQQPVEETKFAANPVINAETKAAARPVRLFATESHAIAEPSIESRHRAPSTPPIVHGLATAPSAAQLLMPAVAAVPVTPIARGARARPETAFNTVAVSSPAPTIRVTIGRVEVRAIMPAPQVTTPVARSAPKMSLDDYLRSRNGGAA